MQRNTSIAAKAAVLLSAAMLTGCAFVPDTVHPEYKPTANINMIPGANAVDLSVAIKNEKKHPKRVSVTLDGYGIPMAGVYMDVQKDFKKAFINALKSRGFVINEKAPDKFGVTVIHFYLKEQQHFWAPSHTGFAELSVSVKHNGKVVFSHTYQSKTKWQSSVSISNAGRQKTAEITLNKIVNKIVTDPQVIDALFKAAGKTPPSDLGVTVPASVASH